MNRDFRPDEIYSDGYFSGGTWDGYSDYVSSEPVLRSEFRRVLDEMQRLGCSSGNLLEIGCAYGFFLAEARKHFDVNGIEVCDSAAEFCRSRGLNVLTGPADEALIGHRGPYDAVVMLDVIEHLPEARRGSEVNPRTHEARRFAHIEYGATGARW